MMRCTVAKPIPVDIICRFVAGSKVKEVLEPSVEIEGLASVAQLQRVLTIVMMDLLGLDNSLGRARSLIAVVGMAAKLLEVQANHPEEGQEYERAVIGPDGVARVLLPGGRTKVVDPVEAEFTT